MADVTGPVSTLPGDVHRLPEDATCDNHEDRPSVRRVQGETDSFGCEMIDYCQECWDKEIAHRQSDEGLAEAAEARTGKCDWCKTQSADLREARDYEEGMTGPVYRVCGACIKRRNDRYREETDSYYDAMDDSWDGD